VNIAALPHCFGQRFRTKTDSTEDLRFSLVQT
jgi:hypothetical protein